eukprot:1188685-Rhodomonas_salina.2
MISVHAFNNESSVGSGCWTPPRVPLRDEGATDARMPKSALRPHIRHCEESLDRSGGGKEKHESKTRRTYSYGTSTQPTRAATLYCVNVVGCAHRSRGHRPWKCASPRERLDTTTPDLEC